MSRDVPPPPCPRTTILSRVQRLLTAVRTQATRTAAGDLGHAPPAGSVILPTARAWSTAALPFVVLVQYRRSLHQMALPQAAHGAFQEPPLSPGVTPAVRSARAALVHPIPRRLSHRWLLPESGFRTPTPAPPPVEHHPAEHGANAVPHSRPPRQGSAWNRRCVGTSRLGCPHGASPAAAPPPRRETNDHRPRRLRWCPGAGETTRAVLVRGSSETRPA